MNGIEAARGCGEELGEQNGSLQLPGFSLPYRNLVSIMVSIMVVRSYLIV